MNKKQAAEFLNVSEKTIERAVKSNQLAASYVKGSHGKTPVFEQAELERYKAERDTILHNPSIVATPEQTTPAFVSNELATTKDTSTDNRQSNVASFADALADALSRRAQTVSLTDKLTLSITDAANLSGLSKTLLRTAIKDGKLKTVPGSHGAKHIRRADLDSFIESL